MTEETGALRAFLEGMPLLGRMCVWFFEGHSTDDVTRAVLVRTMLDVDNAHNIIEAPDDTLNRYYSQYERAL